MKRVTQITVTLLLLLSGCSTSQINYNTKNQTFQYRLDNRVIAQSRAKRLYKNRLRLAHINIYQNVYALENGNIITYEEAYTDPAYIFVGSIDLLVYRIFDKYHSKFIKRVGNVYFYKLTTDDKTLYMLVQNRSKKKLDFFYGTNKAGFEALLNGIEPLSGTKHKNTGETIEIKNAADYIQSSWNYKHSIFSELVKREGGRARAHK